MWLPALPTDFSACLCHSWSCLNTLKTGSTSRIPVAPGKHWEQPGWARLLTWKTSTCAPGTWLVFVPEIHRPKKIIWHQAWHSCRARIRERHLQGAELGTGVSGGVGCDSQLQAELSSAWQKHRGQCLCPCSPLGGWKLGREKESFCSLLSQGEIPGEEAEGNATQTSTNDTKTLQNEPWNTNTAKSLPSRAPRGTTRRRWAGGCSLSPGFPSAPAPLGLFIWVSFPSSGRIPELD